MQKLFASFLEKQARPTALQRPKPTFQHFLTAQDPIYADVLAELRAGQKRTHWMWFIFPQLLGLGHSAMSRRYALASSAEAAAYLAHPVLGARLLACTGLVLAAQGRTIHEMFGSPDDLKFRSCMTLFSEASGQEIFAKALLKPA